MKDPRELLDLYASSVGRNVSDAVRFSMASLGERYAALAFRAPVLDLSSRADVSVVAARLAGTEVRL